MAAALGCLCVSLAVHAQQDDTFQLVSIKKVGQSLEIPAGTSISWLRGGRFEASKATLGDLALMAFGLEQGARRGIVDRKAPIFVLTDRFDVMANADREWTAPPAGDWLPVELRRMLKAMLEDRFALEARVEMRSVDVYALHVASPTGAPGPGLIPSTGECLGPYTAPPKSPTDARPKCPLLIGTSRLEAYDVTLPEIARILTNASASMFDRPIVDQTGLDGRYDVRLVLGIGNRPIARDGLPGAMRQAIEEQLGLRMDKVRAPLPTLVIEKAKTPTDD